MKQVDYSVSTIAALLGARGGRKMTPKKLKAIRLNAEKARAAKLAKHREKKGS